MQMNTTLGVRGLRVLVAMIFTVVAFMALPVQAATYYGIDVRIEAEETLFSDTVWITDEGCTVTDASGVTSIIEGASAICAFTAAADQAGLSYELLDYGFGLYLNSIDEYIGDLSNYWLYYVNYESGSVGLADYLLSDGDELLLSYGSDLSALRLTLDAVQITTGEEVTATVDYYSYDWMTDSGEYLPAENVGVTFGNTTILTDMNGQAVFSTDDSAAYSVQADADNYTRSYVTTLRVYQRIGSFNTLSKYRRTEIRKNGIAYLKGAMDSDGLVDGDQSLTEWSAMALAASGKKNKKMFRAVKQYDPGVADGTTTLARHAMTLEAIGKNARNYKKVNYIQRMKKTFGNSQFGDENLCNDDIFAVLALISADEKSSSLYIHESVESTFACQNDDGGFSYTPGGASDVDTTASWYMMAQHLRGTDIGLDMKAKRKAALGYLKKSQNPDGGWGYADGAVSNASSTSWVLQALRSRRHEAKRVKKNNLNGFHFLGEVSSSDGAFAYDALGTSSVESLNTAYAVMALKGKSFPVNKKLKFKKKKKKNR